MLNNPIGFRNELIGRRPDQQPGTPEDWDVFITRGMAELFDQEPAKRKATASEIPELFDEYILFQSATMGWRILLSTEVQRRMSVWWLEPSGPDKFKRLGKALALSAERVQGTKRAPITDPDLYQGRKDTIAELKSLFQQIAYSVTAQRVRPTSDSLIGIVSTIVKADVRAFPILNRNFEPLLEFLKDGHNRYADRLRSGNKVSPTMFFDEWSARRRHYDPEHFRQEVSRLGSLNSSR
jgi:hypothetical protein